MTIIKNNFSPSINIVRDFNNDVNYILTANSKRIFHQILNDYQIGTRSFNIIGSYGIGKSSFLLAFEQYLKGKKNYFDDINGDFKQRYNFQFLNLIGEYASIIDTFASYFDMNSSPLSSNFIIKKLNNHYQQFSDKNTCLVIVIDEFGKFLEYASSNSPERELYFIQQLAEYVNDSQKNILLITVLHQSFDEYSRKLNQTQRQEWEKVKGRLKEVAFNEPVEQLLFLAAERIKKKKFKLPKNLNTKDLLNTIEKSKVFPLRTKISLDLAQKLYPFDVLSASILTLALQTYGQNERSLFTFLESDDPVGLSYFISEKAPYYNLCNVYDYLLKNFSPLLTTKYNPHFFQWRAIQNSIDRIDSTLDKNNFEAIKLVKTIGLLNIFTLAGSKIDIEFLNNYAKISLNIDNALDILKDLENKKIIRYLNYKNQYILFEGTDLNIEIEIKEAATKVAPITDIITPLRKYFSFPYLIAKAVSYEIGTPRFFYFQLSDTLMKNMPIGLIDGTINLIFSKNINKEDVIDYSKNHKEAILFGLYQNTEKIRENLFEIKKIKFVIDHLVDDRVAERELRNILDFKKQALNQCVFKNLYRNTDEIIWIFNGEEVRINNRSHFNNLLSIICKQIYQKTPVFRNELINREKLPSAISKARKNLFKTLINSWDQEDIGFGKEEFPPEKTIYLALLKKTGIHRKEDESYCLGCPTEETFKPLWEESEIFLEDAKSMRKNLNDFFQLLSSKPFKLKKGFIDFWVPIFLYIKREDFALFSDSSFIPNINFETLELIIKSPEKFQLKTFELHGVKLNLFNKYRSFLNQKSNQFPSTSSFIETIKPFLSFYNSLPEYSKRTNRLSQSTLRLRKAIANATDPEKTFFEEFPEALGYTTLNLNKSEDSLTDYIVQLQYSIRELRGCFDELFNRIEKSLIEATGQNKKLSFSERQNEIRNRYKSLKKQLLLPHQALFFQQLTSYIDDRKSWLRTIVQALLGKPIEKIRDEEEELILEKMRNTLLELDNLCDLSKIEINPEKEEIIKLDITSFKSGRKSQLLRIAKSREKQILDLKIKIKNDLSKDKSTNISALIKLLQEEISNE